MKKNASKFSHYFFCNPSKIMVQQFCSRFRELEVFLHPVYSDCSEDVSVKDDPCMLDPASDETSLRLANANKWE